MIWCVEDDASIREIEMYTLRSTGFEAEGFPDGDSFFEALKTERPELIILDVMLPGEDGIEILKKLKNTAATADIPVIMATAKGMEYDKIKGLDTGADDYLVKPFGMMEMVSRVKAVLRRCQRTQADTTIRVGGLTVNPRERRVAVNGEAVILTYKEFEVLYLLCSRPGMVFTRDQMLESIWGMEYDGETRTVDVHIRTLRQKLGECGALIETVRNVGYRLGVKEA